MTSNKNKIIFISGTLYFLIYWHRLYFAGRAPFDGNMLRFFYPNWVIGKDLLQHGAFLWDSFRNMGQPFLADPQCHALYPLRFVCYFVNFLTYFKIHVLFHTLLAGVFMGLLIFDLTKKREAVALAVLLICFNGVFLRRVTLPPHFATMAWAPAVLYYARKNKPIQLAYALTLQWLAGFPPFFILTLLAVGIFLLAEKAKRPHWISFLGSMGLMLGLSAIQFLPFLGLLHESNRGFFFSTDAAQVFSVPPFHLLKELFLPGWFITPQFSVVTIDPAIVSFFVSPLFLFLFCLGIAKGRRQEKVMGVFALISLVLSLGHNTGFYRNIPFITIFRYPGNWLFLALLLFIPVGVQGWLKIKSEKIRFVFFLLIAADLLLYALPLKIAWGDLDFFKNNPQKIMGLEPSPLDRRIFHTGSILNRVDSWGLASKDDWVLFKGMLTPSYGTAAGVKEVSSYDQLVSKRHLKFLERLDNSHLDSPLYDVANIGKIVTVTQLGLTKPTPVWSEVMAMDNPGNPKRVSSSSMTSVHVLEDKPGSISLATEGEGRFVLSEAYQPGWKALIDGISQPVEIYEEEFVSTRVGPGKHDVRFVYRPDSFLVGAALSLLTLLGMMLFDRTTKEPTIGSEDHDHRKRRHRHSFAH